MTVVDALLPDSLVRFPPSVVTISGDTYAEAVALRPNVR
jgi:hypothetical protein